MWALRLQCVPSASLGLAQALAEREDTRWVQLASGGTEIICHLAVHSDSDRDALLMDRLPSSRRVTSITAHRMLRLFKGGPTTWDGPTSALSREQMDALAPSYPPPHAQAAPVQLTDLDHVLLAALNRDGRASHAALAVEARCHESTVRRRIAHLRTAGALFFVLDVDVRLLGDPSGTAIWMSVQPSQLAAAACRAGGPPRSGLRRRHHGADQPPGQRPLLRRRVPLRVPLRPHRYSPGHRHGRDRADHPHSQARRRSRTQSQPRDW